MKLVRILNGKYEIPKVMRNKRLSLFPKFMANISISWVDPFKISDVLISTMNLSVYLYEKRFPENLKRQKFYLKLF